MQGMADNPYESPKTESRASAWGSTAALVVFGVLSVPAGFICGGMTGVAVGVTGEVTSGRTGFNWPWIGWVGMLSGLIVLVAIPAVTILTICWLLRQLRE